VVCRALVENLLYGTSPEETIRVCRNLHEFTTVYSRGSAIQAVKLASSPDDAGQSMPDLVRFYLGGGQHCLYKQNAKGWSKVPDSQGAVVANHIGLQ
jgi:hypothetical protein